MSYPELYPTDRDWELAMSTDTPTTNQCSICLDGPPYDKCAGSEAPGASSCAYLIELEAKLASAQATITGDGKVIDQYRERLASVTEERDRLKLALDATYELNREHIAYLEQQLAASRGVHKDCLIVPRTISEAEADCLGMPVRLYEKAVRYGAARTYTWTTDPPAALSDSAAKEAK